MATCPNCGAKLSIFRGMLATPTKPSQCAQCGSHYRFRPPFGVTMLAALCGVAGSTLIKHYYPNIVGWIAGLVCILVVAFIFGVCVAVFGRATPEP